MDDLRGRFRSVDSVRAPDLWEEIEEREPHFPSAGRRRSGGPIALGTAGLIAAVIAAVLVAGRDDARLELGDTVPAVNANGKIAFIRSDPATAVREGGPIEAALYTMEPDGSGLSRIAESATHRSGAAWSPDGTKIAFARGGIVVVSASGGGDEEVFRCAPPRCDGVGSPAWSPNGKQIALWISMPGNSGLWIRKPGPVGDFHYVVLVGEELRILGGPSWSPDGREIAVTETDGKISVVGVPEKRILRAFGSEFGESPAWSPDGKQIAAAAAEGGVYLMNPDGSGLKRITNGDDHYPAWSPDGKFIVFTRGTDEPGSDGFVGDLYVIEVETGAERQLTRGPGLDCCASWQPVPRA